MRHVWMLEKEEAARGAELLEQALEIDADYPLALALAGWCWAQHSVYNWVDDMAAAKAQALALADQAANLSTDDPLILAVLGAVHTFARNYGAARVVLERARRTRSQRRLGAEPARLARTSMPTGPTTRRPFRKGAAAQPARSDELQQLRGHGQRPAGGWRRQCCRRSVHPRASRASERALDPSQSRHPHCTLQGASTKRRASLDALLAAYPGMTIAKFKEAMVFSPAMLDRLAELLRTMGVPE